MPEAIPRPRATLSPWWAPLGLVLLAMLPVAFIATQAAAASRNIVFWDEFDTALDFIIRLDAGADWNETLGRFFEVNNEHRMFTSRLLFAESYWLTGTVNFHIIGAIGNFFIVGACALLVAGVETTARRIRLGVVLAFLVFQLEHFENFLWSGASIDHFQVVMFAVAALAAVARGTRFTLLGGGLLAFLATFTLAHGGVVWPVGALLLLRERRWQHLAFWCALGAAVTGAFLHGFRINPAHHVFDLSAAGLGRLVHYWLSLLGGPPAFGHTSMAPTLGLLLLVALGWLGLNGAARREPLLFSVALYAVGALALVAVGRSEVAGGLILSRYMILGAFAWSVVIFLGIEYFASPAHPFRFLLWCLPALAVFNLTANARFGALAEGYAEARDRAASRFAQYGEDGHGPVRLHPKDGHARALLQLAEKEGVYSLPLLCEPRSFPALQSNPNIVSHVDENEVTANAVCLGGWAMLPNQLSKRGQIHVVLRSRQRELIFNTISIQRPDVAAAYQEPRWRLSGFRFVVTRDRLPAEDFQVGVVLSHDGMAEVFVTDQWLRLSGSVPAAAQLAKGP